MGERDATASRPVRRQEAKAITRRRLLDAALLTLDAEGPAAITTTRVTRVAGISQSSFYVHFDDVDDLLRTTVAELALERRRLTRDARRTARAAPCDVERLRQTFRVPLQTVLAHPMLFRLLLRTRHDAGSPLGEWSRSDAEASRAALVDDLAASGLPMTTVVDRRRTEMVADCLIASTESLAVGHLDGRYPDVEEIVDMLVRFCHGYFPSLRPALESPAKAVNG
ncbi:MAG: TetR/AcrR family transcriptional regulator [Actinomycetota bacterium]|nr:TetR/AcrR family transcriptional regulator [Actinomycetota bacterium]